MMKHMAQMVPKIANGIKQTLKSIPKQKAKMFEIVLTKGFLLIASCE